MVVRNLALSNNYVMREHSSNCFVETAANGFFRHIEFRPGLVCPACSSSSAFSIKCEGASGVDLKVGAGAVAFDGIAPLRNLPFEFDFGQRGLGQIDLHAVPGGFDIAKVDQTGEGG